MRFVQAGVMILGAIGYVLIPIAVVWAAPALSESSGPEAPLYILIAVVVVWNLVLLTVTVLVIVDSVKKIRSGRTRELASGVLLVKLAAIPFYLINFALLLLVAFGVLALSLRIIGILLLPFVIPIVIAGVILTYLLLLSTSIYGFAAIARLRRERSIGTGLTVLYALLLLVFVVDIAAAVMVFGHSRRRAGTALVVLLLTAGAVLVAIWAALFDPDGGFDARAWIGIGGAAMIVGTIVITLLRRARLRSRQPSVEGVVTDGSAGGVDPQRPQESERETTSVAEAGHDPATSRL